MFGSRNFFYKSLVYFFSVAHVVLQFYLVLSVLGFLESLFFVVDLDLSVHFFLLLANLELHSFLQSFVFVELLYDLTLSQLFFLPLIIFLS